MMKNEDVARICHEANRAYCASIGDDSQLSWEDAPEWQKNSAIAGVVYHRENPTAGPSGSHENWLAVKRAEGWVYGETKNPELKQHPCMVDYNDLPLEQRRKDYIFTAIVHALSQ